MNKVSEKKQRTRTRRRVRIRKKVTGTPERPRLSVFRSNRYIYAQLIDDIGGHTLATACSKDAEAQGEGSTADSAAAGRVGELLAKRAKAKKIASAVFDRGGYRYHGRVAALADGARKGGLSF